MGDPHRPAATTIRMVVKCRTARLEESFKLLSLVGWMTLHIKSSLTIHCEAHALSMTF